MTYFFRQDSEVCIRCTLYYRGSDITDAGRSHDDNNMANVVCPDYIYTTHIHTI